MKWPLVTLLNLLLCTVVFTQPKGSGTAKVTKKAVIAASCSQAHVQAAVDIATSGSTVLIPAGTCTWTTSVGLNNSNIWVQGAGIGKTIINGSGPAAFLFYVYTGTTGVGANRISHMTLGGAVNGSVIYFTSTALHSVQIPRWRVDHIHFNFTSGQRSGVHTAGVNYGLVDHNTWTWHAGIAIRQANALNTECAAEGSDPEGSFQNAQGWGLGTDEFLFVEDNDFTFNWASGNSILYDSSSGGGKVVIRHNTLTGALFYNHWTRGCAYSAQVYEVYNNHWIGTSQWGNFDGYIATLEAGTGVFYNNFIEGYRRGVNPPWITVSERRGDLAEAAPPLGTCDGTKAWDGNAGDTTAVGWPCLGQVGRAPGKTWAQIISGDRPTSAPIYLWNNGETSGCRTGGACTDTLVIGASTNFVKNTPHTVTGGGYGQGDVDYVQTNTPMPGYSALVYPHPKVKAWP